MDLHLHDTYYVLQGYLFPLFSLLFLLALWWLYVRVGNRIKSKPVAYLHMILSIGLLVFIAISPLIYAGATAGGGLILAFVLFLLVQILFVINLKRSVSNTINP